MFDNEKLQAAIVPEMTIDEFKSKFERGELESSLYSAKVDGKDGFITVGTDGFSTCKPTHNGWNEVLTYEFIDGLWHLSTTYVKD